MGRFRSVSLLLAGAYAVHTLRYALAYGHGAPTQLLRQGHGYLLAAPYTLTFALALAASQLLLRAAAGAGVPAIFAGWGYGPPEMAAGAAAIATAPHFDDLSFEETHAAGEVPLSMLMDLTLPVSIELGRTSMTVQEILRLGRGAVIQLDRLAGEPIDIYVGDRKFAEGEVVVLGEHFGVRISRIFATSGVNAAAA
jgi:flagellar motor switch protein FliN/FliY